MPPTEELPLFNETEYDYEGPVQLITSCPTLDLSTFWDAAGRNLHIIRTPGQTVSKIHQVAHPGSRAPEVACLTWKHDGQFLAVGWSDGVVRLMGLENNKTAHHITAGNSQETRIVHIGWAVNNLNGNGLRKKPKPIYGEFAKEWSEKKQDGLVNLPQELTFLEVETALPKISPLPAATAGPGEDAMVFTLRTGLDFLFQPLKEKDYDDVNVMIVGTSDGKLHLSIYDSFTVGSFDSHQSERSNPYQLLLHASHRQISTHCLLLADDPSKPKTVRLVPMDLPFVHSAPINISLLSSKLTTLQTLLRYLKQTQLHMEVEWKNLKELPSRFLRSVEEDLEKAESGPRSIVPALFHTVVTGHAHEPLREWLVDSLAERGQKRWDKAVVSALEGLRSLVHENFLPALERCSIILSRLRGLAQFYDHRDDIGFSSTKITRVVEAVGALSLIGNKILLLVMDELESFNAFSIWLRFTIDRLASSSASEELTEKEATMDNSKTLTYIQKYLVNNPLDIYFDQIAQDDYAADLSHLEDGADLPQELDKQLKKQETGQASMRALPHVEFLVDYTITRSKRIFDGVAEAMRRSVRFGTGVDLPTGDEPITAIDMVMGRNGNKGGTIFSALSSQAEKKEVRLYRLTVDVINGISNNQALEECRLRLDDGNVTDLKFLNPTTLIVLYKQSNDSFHILVLPTQSSIIKFTNSAHGHHDSGPTPLNLSSFPAESFKVYSVPREGRFKPMKMEVHDKSSIRGEIPGRVCILGENGTTLRTFTLPSL